MTQTWVTHLFGHLRCSSRYAGHPKPCSGWPGPRPGEPCSGLWWLKLHGPGPLVCHWHQTEVELHSSCRPANAAISGGSCSTGQNFSARSFSTLLDLDLCEVWLPSHWDAQICCPQSSMTIIQLLRVFSAGLGLPMGTGAFLAWFLALHRGLSLLLVLLCAAEVSQPSLDPALVFGAYGCGFVLWWAAKRLLFGSVSPRDHWQLAERTHQKEST